MPVLLVRTAALILFSVLAFPAFAQTCTSGPVGGSPWPAPGTIEAEDFDCGGEGVGYHDLTPGNQSTSTYRDPESVDVMDMAGGGRTVQHFDTGEWMNYTINVAADGYYSVAILAASNWAPQGQVAGEYSIEVGGANTGGVDVISTGSWDVYDWATAPAGIFLPAGQHVLKLNSVQQSYRVDKIRLEASTPPSCEAPAQRPFTGTPIQIPTAGAEFESEDYDCGGEGAAYHDLTPGNQSTSTYRDPESVDVMDMAGGGRTVQQFDTGEWMEYTINIATAGDYNFAIFAASNWAPQGQVAGQYSIEIAGGSTGNVDVSSTGNWDSYVWAQAPTSLFLTAGQHVLKLNAVQQAYRVDKLRVTPAGAPPPGDCGSGVDLCIRFEAAPDTQFSTPDVNHIRTQKSAAPVTTVDWSVQNKAFDQCNGDRADDPLRIGRAGFGRGGSDAIRFTTQERDDCVHSSGNLERSEIQLSAAASGGSPGQEQWWAHSVYLPADAPIPPMDDYNASGFFQFHGQRKDRDQPNFIMDIFHEPGTLRPVLRVVTSGDNGSGGEVEQYSYRVNSSHYVRGQCIHSWPSNVVQTGVWYDFVHHIRWGVNGTGLHEIWMRQGDGPAKKVMSRTNINTLYTNDNAYLKLGLYHVYLPGASSVIHDRLRRGDSFEAVANFPRPSETIVPCGGY